MGLGKKQLGNRGEEEAARFLQRLGWRVLERNYRCRMGEIDIIAVDSQGTLVFAEVRSRSSLSCGLPEESVINKKQNKLRMLAQQYLLARPKLAHNPCRFDVLAVTFNELGEVKTIRHIQNAF